MTTRSPFAMKAKIRAIGRLHTFQCPLPGWESVGQHFGREKPTCTCGASERIAQATESGEWAVPAEMRSDTQVRQASRHWFTPDDRTLCGRYTRAGQRTGTGAGTHGYLDCCKACLGKLERLRKAADA